MISANSLTAFSGSAASAPLALAAGMQPVQLRSGGEGLGAAAKRPAAPPASDPQANGPLPRGSLLDLAI